MYVHGHLFAGTPILQKVQIGEALPLAGVPLIASALADADGVMRASTTAAAEAIGISYDAQPTRNTAQQTGDADPAVYVTVNVRPDQIVRGRLSGGATAGTALPEFTNTVASTNGLLITAAFGTAYDDGYAYGATGANAGRLRKIQGAVNTTATPIVAFPSDIAVGDIFYALTFGHLEDAGVQLTTGVTEIDATGDNQSGTNFRCRALALLPKAQGGALNSYADLVFVDHLFIQQ
jgi:hypothetical protein